MVAQLGGTLVEEAGTVKAGLDGPVAPPADEEPTSEQFAAFAYLIDNNLPPYVDFGMFGPYNARF